MVFCELCGFPIIYDYFNVQNSSHRNPSELWNLRVLARFFILELQVSAYVFGHI